MWGLPIHPQTLVTFQEPKRTHAKGGGCEILNTLRLGGNQSSVGCSDDQLVQLGS